MHSYEALVDITWSVAHACYSGYRNIICCAKNLHLNSSHVQVQSYAASSHNMMCLQDDREGQRSCTATGTGKNINPCARNTFLLAKYTPEKLDVSTTVYDDDVLHYGQKVHIIAHPSVQKLPVDSSGGPKPLRLFSKQMSTTHYSKYTRQQV